MWRILWNLLMSNISVKYSGTFLDPSGYASANRSFITSLFLAGIDVATELIVQSMARAKSYGWTGELCKNLEDRIIPYNIKFIHLTPDCYPNYMETGKYHIGHLFSETDKLPKEWIDPCNMMNEIWTASEPQAEMFRRSGVKVPIYCFPQPIDIVPSQKQIRPFIIPSFKGKVFYSIFQWIDRKNPKALLTNYWKTFQGNYDVVLLIKTYRVNYSDEEFQLITDDIREWKKELGLEHYPRVLLVKKLLNAEDMMRLHATGNVYINTSRGEGWCIPAIEASLMGNPVISIDKTGYADYFSKDIYYPCRSKLEPVTVQKWIPWYEEGMKWLEINAQDLVKHMKSSYNQPIEAAEIGKKAQKYVVDNFNYLTVGKLMRERLEAIQESL